MNSVTKGKNDLIFIEVLAILIFTFLTVAIVLFLLSHSSNIVLYKLILNIIVILIAILCFYVLMNTVLFIRLLKGKKMSRRSKKIANNALTLLYPQVLFLAQLLGLDKNRIRRVFANINNKIVLVDKKLVKPEEILLLLPHCLQKSSCNHKITNNINNCKKCGLCSISSIIDLQKDYNIQAYVATGGTLARKIVKEVKPKLILAVACERDLSSGILDIRKIPVYGVLLERPEGPCFNTKVDLIKIRETIELFIYEEENSCSSIHPIMDLDRG